MVPCKVASEEWLQNFPTNEVSLPFFWLVEANLPCCRTNQKYYPDLGSDTSSVWNFCICSSDVTLQGNQWWCLMSAVFLGLVPWKGVHFFWRISAWQANLILTTEKNCLFSHWFNPYHVTTRPIISTFIKQMCHHDVGMIIFWSFRVIVDCYFF